MTMTPEERWTRWCVPASAFLATPTARVAGRDAFLAAIRAAEADAVEAYKREQADSGLHYPNMLTDLHRRVSALEAGRVGALTDTLKAFGDGYREGVKADQRIPAFEALEKAVRVWERGGNAGWGAIGAALRALDALREGK